MPSGFWSDLKMDHQEIKCLAFGLWQVFGAFSYALKIVWTFPFFSENWSNFTFHLQQSWDSKFGADLRWIDWPKNQGAQKWCFPFSLHKYEFENCDKSQELDLWSIEHQIRHNQRPTASKTSRPSNSKEGKDEEENLLGSLNKRMKGVLFVLASIGGWVWVMRLATSPMTNTQFLIRKVGFMVLEKWEKQSLQISWNKKSKPKKRLKTINREEEKTDTREFIGWVKGDISR